MEDKSVFNFKPWGQGMTRGRGRGRSRSRGRARGLMSLCVAPRFLKSAQEQQAGQRIHTEGKPKTPNLAKDASFFSQMEMGNNDSIRTPEAALSPESSSSSKRSCTEMEESEETKSTLLKRRCKKSLSGTFACSRDNDGMSGDKADVCHKTSKEVACTVVASGENWDEEIENEQRSEQSHCPPGLKLVQDAYDTCTSGSNGSETIGGTKEQKSNRWTTMQIGQGTLKGGIPAPLDMKPNTEVDNLSNAVTENCTCTSDEDAQRGLKDLHELRVKGTSSQSFSSPTAGSKTRPHVHERSKSDSWISGMTEIKNSKKKEKIKRRHRSATIMECDESSDEEIGIDMSLRSASSKGPRVRHRRASQSSEDLVNSHMSTGRVETKVEHQKGHHAKIKSSVSERTAHESEDCEADVESSQAEEYDSPADEQWNSVVKKLSADGADTEDITCTKSKISDLVDNVPNGMGHQTHFYQNSMDRPLQFQPGFRARHPSPHPIFPMAYDNPSMQALNYQYSYPPPPPHMWPMMPNPYYCGRPMYGGYHSATMPTYPESYPGNLTSQSGEHVGMDYVDNGTETFSQDYVDPSKCGLFEEEDEENNSGFSHSVPNTDTFDNEYICKEPNEAHGKVKTFKPGSAVPKIFIPRQVQSTSKNTSKSPSLMSNEIWRQRTSLSEDPKQVEPFSSLPSTVDIQPQTYGDVTQTAEEQQLQGSPLLPVEDTDQQLKQKQNWYEGTETSTEMVSSLRRKSRVWGRSITHKTHQVTSMKHETSPPQKSIPVLVKKEYCPPTYATIAASSQKTNGASSLLTSKDNTLYSVQTQEWRRGCTSNVPTLQGSWRPKLSPTDYVSPQDKLDNLSKVTFWRKTPSPTTSTTEKRFRNWSSGSQGWGSLDITPLPRRVSEPPKPIQVIQRPRRFSLEDEVRAETVPRTSSLRSSSESEDILEIPYPASDIDYIDSHCHIDLLFQRYNYRGPFSKFSLSNKFPANFAGCVAIFCYPINFSSGYTLAEELLKEANIWGSFGCHPHQVKHYDGVMEKRIKEWMNHPKTVAFGEIGLDYSDR